MSHTLAWTICTAILLLALPTVIGTYDGIAELVGGNSSTISFFCQEVAANYPAFGWSLCLLFGLLVGHVLTIRDYPRAISPWISVPLFVLVPYFVIVATSVMQLHVLIRPLIDAGKENPHGFHIGFLIVGYEIGSRILHQTRGVNT